MTERGVDMTYSQISDTVVSPFWEMGNKDELD